MLKGEGGREKVKAADTFILDHQNSLESLEGFFCQYFVQIVLYGSRRCGGEKEKLW